MTTRQLRRSLVIVSLIGLATACGCQGSPGNFVSGVLSKPSQLRSAWARRSTSLADARKLDRPVEPHAGAPEVTKQNFSSVQLAMARSFENEGHLQSAKAAYEAALRNDPSSALAHHRLALIHERMGQSEESPTHFQKALELEPGNAEICCDLGYWYSLRYDWDQAERHLRRATELDPRLARAHNNLAFVLARTGRTEGAMQHFAQAGLSDAEAHTNLGFVHLTEQRFPEAQTQLNLAIASDPKSPKARNLVASLNRVAASGPSPATHVPPAANPVRPAAVRPETQPADPGGVDVSDSIAGADAPAGGAEAIPRIRLAAGGPSPATHVPPPVKPVRPAAVRPERPPVNPGGVDVSGSTAGVEAPAGGAEAIPRIRLAAGAPPQATHVQPPVEPVRAEPVRPETQPADHFDVDVYDWIAGVDAPAEESEGTPPIGLAQGEGDRKPTGRVPNRDRKTLPATFDLPAVNELRAPSVSPDSAGETPAPGSNGRATVITSSAVSRIEPPKPARFFGPPLSLSRVIVSDRPEPIKEGTGDTGPIVFGAL